MTRVSPPSLWPLLGFAALTAMVLGGLRAMEAHPGFAFGVLAATMLGVFGLARFASHPRIRKTTNVEETQRQSARDDREATGAGIVLGALHVTFAGIFVVVSLVGLTALLFYGTLFAIVLGGHP